MSGTYNSLLIILCEIFFYTFAGVIRQAHKIFLVRSILPLGRVLSVRLHADCAGVGRQKAESRLHKC